MPLVEQRRRAAVGGHEEEEARIQLVADVVARLTVEDQDEVLAIAVVQLRERVPQPHNVHVFAKISTSMALRFVADAQDCPTAKVAVTIGTAPDLGPILVDLYIYIFNTGVLNYI